MFWRHASKVDIFIFKWWLIKWRLLVFIILRKWSQVVKLISEFVLEAPYSINFSTERGFGMLGVNLVGQDNTTPIYYNLEMCIRSNGTWIPEVNKEQYTQIIFLVFLCLYLFLYLFTVLLLIKLQKRERGSRQPPEDHIV